MKKRFPVLAVISCALLSVSAFAADQTKLYDPVNEQKKIVIPVELLAKEGNTQIGQVVVVESAYGLVFYPQLSKLASGMHGFHIHEKPTADSRKTGSA